jgi:putative heme-binding domain-containing protein
MPNPTESDEQTLQHFLPLFRTNSTVQASLAGQLTRVEDARSEARAARLLTALSELDFPDVPRPLATAILGLLTHANPALRSRAVRACAALRLAGAEAALTWIAGDSSQAASLRIEALRELVRRRPAVDADSFGFLLGQLDRGQPPSGRLAAADALVHATLDAMQLSAFLKAVRGDALIAPALVLPMVERVGVGAVDPLVLLDYLAAGLEVGWSLPSETLMRIQEAIPESVRPAAASLMARVEESIDRQRRLLLEFEPLLQGGDVVRGERLFHERAQCTVCHRVWGNGGRVGPDLTGIGRIRSGRDILESILVPSSTIAQGYETLLVTTKEGESHTGVRAGKGEEPLRLRLASGAEIVLHQQQIESIDPSKLSIMPEGLVSHLARDEMRDLLAYLQNLR